MLDHFSIIKTDPLLLGIGIRTHPFLRVPHQFVILILHTVTDLQEQVTSFNLREIKYNTRQIQLNWFLKTCRHKHINYG